MKLGLFSSGGPRKKRDWKRWSADWCSRPQSNNSALCPAIWQKAITVWPSTTSVCPDCPSVQPAIYLFLHWVSSKGKNCFVNTVNNWSGFWSPPLMASLGCFVASRDGVHPAWGAQPEAAGGGEAATAGEGPLHAGLWLQAGAAQTGRAAGAEGETLWRGDAPTISSLINRKHTQFDLKL